LAIVRTEWQKVFRSVPPVGWKLRDAFPDRWARIHSLPDSKRYAESDEERQVLLERQLLVAQFVLNPKAHCYFFTHRYVVEADESTRDAAPAIGGAPLTEQWREPAETDKAMDDGAREELRILGAKGMWPPERIEVTLLAVGNDEDRLVVLSRDTGQVFAPYDGGVDVILSGPAAVQRFRDRFAAWLSMREDGL
jgi:hypothetical protein